MHWVDVAVLALLALLVRIPAYVADKALTFDDGVFANSAIAMRDGGLPFRDVFSSQGPAVPAPGRPRRPGGAADPGLTAGAGGGVGHGRGRGDLLDRPAPDRSAGGAAGRRPARGVGRPRLGDGAARRRRAGTGVRRADDGTDAAPPRCSHPLEGGSPRCDPRRRALDQVARGADHRAGRAGPAGTGGVRCPPAAPGHHRPAPWRGRCRRRPRGVPGGHVAARVRRRLGPVRGLPDRRGGRAGHPRDRRQAGVHPLGPGPRAAPGRGGRTRVRRDPLATDGLGSCGRGRRRRVLGRCTPMGCRRHPRTGRRRDASWPCRGSW